MRDETHRALQSKDLPAAQRLLDELKALAASGEPVGGISALEAKVRERETQAARDRARNEERRAAQEREAQQQAERERAAAEKKCTDELRAQERHQEWLRRREAEEVKANAAIYRLIAAGQVEDPAEAEPQLVAALAACADIDQDLLAGETVSRLPVAIRVGENARKSVRKALRQAEAKRREAEEASRRAAEEQRRREADDAARRAAEEAARREAEEAARRAAEHQRRREAEEAARREAARQEAARREAEELARREAAVDLARQEAAAEAARQEADAQREAEEARLWEEAQREEARQRAHAQAATLTPSADPLQLPGPARRGGGRGGRGLPPTSGRGGGRGGRGLPTRPSGAAALVPSVTAGELRYATSMFADGRLVGVGGFGRVFRAEGLPSLPGQVAAKILHVGADGRTIQEVLSDLDAETALLHKSNHPNVIRMLACCRDHEAPCAIYPLALGGSLEDRLVLNTNAAKHLRVLGYEQLPSALTWQDRVRVLRDTMEAIVYLHEAVSPHKEWTCFHGDVKPSNILLGCGLFVTLCDVGLAKTASAEASRISVSRLQGTGPYLDPIFVRTNRRTAVTDGYAFGGVVLHTMTAVPLHLLGLDHARVQPMLETASQPEEWSGVLDTKAGGWPDGVAAALAQMVVSLMWMRLEHERMPCRTALERLRELVSTNAIPDALSDAAAIAATPPQEQRSKCIVCYERPHTVRFACGHAICCEECEPRLRASNSNCPKCGAPIGAEGNAERGAHVGTARTFVGASPLRRS